MNDPESRPPETQSPINPLPPVIVALFLLIAGIEAVLWLASQGIVGGPGGIGWRLSALEQYSFSAPMFQWMVETWQFPLDILKRSVTYLFVHANATQAIFVCVMLLALGKMVGEVFAGWATLAIFVISGITGSVIFGFVMDTRVPLIGGFPGVYGFIGAFTFLLWLRLGQMGAQQIRAFSLIGVLMGIQLVFGVLFGAQADWIAEVTGFATGFLLAVLFIPGGWANILRRIRGE